MPCYPRTLLIAVVLALAACGDESTSERATEQPGPHMDQPVAGAGGGQLSGDTEFGTLDDPASVEMGAAVQEPAYEPTDRIDFDNVTNLGGAPTIAGLPEPPKSGFRIVLPVRTVQPGEEWKGCIALPYPKLTHRNVYEARIYTSGALHHSNVIGVQQKAGPSSYPSCPPGTGDAIQIALDNFLSDSPIDVLFANSTQIDGGERLVFPPATAFKVRTDGAEVLADAHYLNAGSEPIDSQVVYDFFTMPDADVEHTLGAMVVHDQSFRVAPGDTKDVVNDCLTRSQGHLVSLMPHAHERTVEFTVEITRPDDSETIFTSGSFDGDSKITVFDDPIALDGARIKQTCRIHNDLDVPIVYGTGTDEMCISFGYITPATEAFVAYKAVPLSPCLTTRTGHLFE